MLCFGFRAPINLIHLVFFSNFYNEILLHEDVNRQLHNSHRGEIWHDLKTNKLSNHVWKDSRESLDVLSGENRGFAM